MVVLGSIVDMWGSRLSSCVALDCGHVWQSSGVDSRALNSSSNSEAITLLHRALLSAKSRLNDPETIR